MATIHTNFVSGTLSADIGASDTVINSSGFAALAEVTATDVAKFVIDPFGENGPPEVVYTNGHTPGATTVTGCLRGQEGTSARPHNVGVLFIHAPLASDFGEGGSQVQDVVNNPGNAIATAPPVTLPVGANNNEGSSSAIARADHVHRVESAVPVASVPGTAAAEGVATTVARSDHAHAREAWFTGTPSAVGGTVGAPGSSDTVARGDHTHPFTTASLNNRSVFGTAVRPVGMSDSQSNVITNDLAMFDKALHRWTGSQWQPLTPCAVHVVDLSSSLQNGWTGSSSLGPPSRYRVGQEVVLQGGLSHGDYDETIFTLPVGWRPSAPKKFLVPTAGSFIPSLAFGAALTVGTDGTVKLDDRPLGSLASNLNVSLDGVRFLVSGDF